LNPLGLFLEPPGPLLTHLHTVYMAYSECLPTRLNPLAERTCFSQVSASIFRTGEVLTTVAGVSVAGIGAAFWGLVFGYAVARIAERKDFG